MTRMTLLVLSFFLTICVSGQITLLSEKITPLKKYDKNHLYRIALPMGGIGTGTVSLGGSGELQDWEVMNVPAKGYSTVTTGNDAPFFAIYTKKLNESPNTKALMGPIHYADYQHYEGRSVDHHGFPRFREASFETTYPFGIVNLADKTMPVTVKVIGYNPLFPMQHRFCQHLLSTCKYLAAYRLTYIHFCFLQRQMEYNHLSSRICVCFHLYL